MNKSHFVLFVFLLLYVKFNAAIDCETVYVTCVENRNIKNATIQKTHRNCVNQSGITAKQFDRLGHTLSEQLRSQQTELKEQFTVEILKLKQTENQQVMIEEKDTIIAKQEAKLNEQQLAINSLLLQKHKYIADLKKKQAMINEMKNNNITQEAKLHDQQMPKNAENDKSMATLKEKVHSPINTTYATSCRDNPNLDGFQTIRVPGMDSFEVLCTSENGGGWTVIMRRQSINDKFGKSTWNEYKTGFGGFGYDFWIGLDKLHLMTKFQSHEMFLDSTIGEMHFSNFSFANETESYKVLTIGSISGHNFYYGTKTDVKFTTTDRDNDNDEMNCADRYRFGWWFDKCTDISLEESQITKLMIRPTSK